jgi:thiamine biosynthesis protein ThiS
LNLDKIRIIVNGKGREIGDSTNVSNLLDDLGLNHERVVIELNEKILAKELFSATALTTGDSVEIIQFVPGG